MNIIYRVLGIVVNIVAMILSFSLLLSIPMLISSPLTMLSGFMMVSIVLYAWFSHQFNKKVVQAQQFVKRSLKDWVKVNGIVALIFSIIVIVDVIYLMQNPQIYIDAIKSFNVDMPLKTVFAFFSFMLAYGIILLAHVIWTFSLLKKHAAFFEENPET
jgi:hypothetical protein